MKQTIVNVSLVVRDYDETIEFYTKKLKFILIQNETDGNKRWVVIAPQNSEETRLVLGDCRRMGSINDFHIRIINCSWMKAVYEKQQY